ncbi:MAG: Glycosyl transferase group 1 [Candidatus Gottesmanbacteria bacterium GW2011_GWA1_34_13]|uniref:Glycosyl transferase group 1 n=1 Tax=Candidatus Gottesmanbacteria bacterium GW2011_GWA1_34_13 TaxID=1618434 RepID=A0A0G0APR7_9BACT|nr:MAG: Glycosyl transferase group 1 [Candidatus Gottesmanbacteria bacterium GW2011_GWA1_34_13]
MRIMFLYMFPLWGNGSGAWLRALAAELVKKGHAVSIVAPESRKLPGVKHYVVHPPQMGVFVGNPELLEAKKYELMSGVELSKIYTTYIDATLPAVKEFQPEIVHAFHTIFLPPVARLIKVLYGIRFLITTHGSDLHYLERDKRFVGLIKDAVKVSSLITANSNFTRRWFMKMFGSDCSDKLRTIPGGVYMKEYLTTQEDKDRIDKKYNLTGKKVVLFTGRLTVHKGVQYLIKAAKQIKGEVIILGDGPERTYLEKLIADYKLTNTRILGYMNPKEQVSFKHFYARADVYVAPSTWNEPLGLVILEAMAAKTPVIVTRSGGVTSLVKDGYNGYLVHVRNATEIAEKANFLLDNDELRKKMGERAQRIVAEKYTWEMLAERFVKIYEKYSFTSKEYLRLVKKANGKPKK